MCLFFPVKLCSRRKFLFLPTKHNPIGTGLSRRTKPVQEVVGDQYFQHRNEPKRGADPVHIYRGGHYQITPPDTAL
jgi:hypothetical protein